MVDSLFYSDQSEKQLVQRTEALRDFSIFYAFGPSTDARKTNEPSEDFLCYEYSSTRLVFVVCDGVGQTMDSDFAARLLAAKLIEFGHQVKAGLDSKVYKENIQDLLNSFPNEVQDKLLSLPNPYKSDDVFHGLIESERRAGAEVKFISGFIDLDQGHIVVFSLGDLLFAAQSKDGGILPRYNDNDWIGRWLHGLKRIGEPPTKWHGKGAWSTTQGVVPAESVTVWKSTSSNLESITVASDGAEMPFIHLVRNGFSNISPHLIEAYNIGRDDISFLHLSLRKTDKEELSQVSEINIFGTDVSWTPVANAEAYRILFEAKDGTITFHEVDKNVFQCGIPTFSQIAKVKIRALSSEATTSDWTEVDLLKNTVPISNIAPTHINTELPNTPTSDSRRHLNIIVLLFAMMLMLPVFVQNADNLQRSLINILLASPNKSDTETQIPDVKASLYPLATLENPALSSNLVTATSTSTRTQDVADFDPSLKGRCTSRQAPEDWVPYKVKEYDILYSIASDLGLSYMVVDDIIRFNCISGDSYMVGRDLMVGEIILVPPH